ncbi:hypothetical protein FQN49_004231 [Arthroderma sp. PD_2]|nr:hypothetical protein FQN49_004231 [Arthroderma sp. PD_2]
MTVIYLALLLLSSIVRPAQAYEPKDCTTSFIEPPGREGLLVTYRNGGLINATWGDFTLDYISYCVGLEYVNPALWLVSSDFVREPYQKIVIDNVNITGSEPKSYPVPLDIPEQFLRDTFHFQLAIQGIDQTKGRTLEYDTKIPSLSSSRFIVADNSSNPSQGPSTSTMRSATPASTGDIPTANPSASANSSPSASAGEGLGTGTKAGIGVGVGVGAIALAAGVFFILRRRRNKRMSPVRPHEMPNSPPRSEVSGIPKEQLSEVPGSLPIHSEMPGESVKRVELP